MAFRPAVGEEARQAAGRGGRGSAPGAAVRAGHVARHRASGAFVVAKRLCGTVKLFKKYLCMLAFQWVINDRGIYIGSIIVKK